MFDGALKYTTRTKAQEIVSRAADLLEEYGHCQGTFRTLDGRMCIATALLKATDPNIGVVHLAFIKRSELLAQALELIAQKKNWESGLQPDRYVSLVCNWNNGLTQTGEKLVAELRSIAA